MLNKIKPLNYDIRLDVDLAASRFQGSVIIRLEALDPTRVIELNLVDLEVSSCCVGRGDLESCEFELLPEQERIRIFLPKETKGELSCHIDYMGMLRDGMTGFYRSRHSAEEKAAYLAVTQFEENEARKAFPCVDHPSMKATFDILLVVDGDLLAVSNAPVKEERFIENGRKAVRFSRTPPMSTYLVFFGVGPFETITDPGRVTMRAMAVTRNIERARFGLDFGRKSLDYLEEYTGHDFPMPKLDLIGVPDFAFGAMENWGAITFRENLLLRDPASTSRTGEERICEVIAHEMAHQWFGNLVTPFSWNELWLNESFATYFAFRVLEAYHPEWLEWDRFLKGHLRAALERDALRDTLAIEISEKEEVVINASTAPIIYNKGGAVLRQLQAFMGEQDFQAGVRSYLSEYAYTCANSSSAWEALERESSRPVEPMIRSWVSQPGFPLVRVRREKNRLLLSQERFSYLHRDYGERWHIPVKILAFLEEGGTRLLSTTLTNRSEVLDLEPGIAGFKLNYGQEGFFRVLYEDPEDLKGLGAAAADGLLPPADRWGVQDDLYALVMRGDASLDDYLGFVEFYRGDRAFLPLTGMGENLLHSWLVHDDPGRRAVLEALGRDIFEKCLLKIGMEPGRDEDLGTCRLREQVLWLAARFQSPRALNFGLEAFERLEKNGPVHPDILNPVLRIAALELGDRAFRWFEERLAGSESEFERTMVLEAMGCFGGEETIRRTLSYVIDRVPARNKFVPFAQMAVNPTALACLWDWYTENIDEINGFHPLHHERIITYTVPLGGLGREDDVHDFFSEDRGHVSGRLRDVLPLALEKLEINRRMRARLKKSA